MEAINNRKRIIPTLVIGDQTYTNPDNAVLARVLGINEAGRVILYGADWCPDCHRAKSYLQDNSIHYIYRFKEEYTNCQNYNETLRICHSTIAKAILNTSITIIFGFSILIFSNFIPTIYFGVLTALAMAIALLASLTVLPALLLLTKPFKNQTY